MLVPTNISFDGCKSLRILSNGATFPQVLVAVKQLLRQG